MRCFLLFWLAALLCRSIAQGRGQRSVVQSPKSGTGSLERKAEGLKEAVMCRTGRDCFIGGEVKGLGSEVKGRLCVIGSESGVGSQESEEESGRTFYIKLVAPLIGAAHHGRMGSSRAGA